MKIIREVEPGLFAPLVVSATGGMSIAANTFYKCLASLINEGSNQEYAGPQWRGLDVASDSSSFFRNDVLMESRSSYHHPIIPSYLPADLMAKKGRVSRW